MTVSHMRKPSQRRPAFTLVELLVVIAIIGVLIAILLPAVQRVRESARRAACASNGRQVGLAIHNFLSTHGRFPRAGRMNGGNAKPDETVKRIVSVRESWILALLPFLEETERYDSWMSGATAANSLDKGPISLLECASSGWAASDLGRSSYPVISNWGAVSGDTLIPVSTPGTGILSGMNGGSPITRDSVQDGLSNTAMLGEIATHDPSTKQFLVVNSDPSGTTRQACQDLTGTVDGTGHGLRPYNASFVQVCMAYIPNTKMCTSYKGNPGIHNRVGTAVASWHPGGAHLVMGDGAVKFVNEDVDCGAVNGDPWQVQPGVATSTANPKGVWGAIATRAGGESGNLP